MESGKLKMESGKWKVENGKWKTESGKRKTDNAEGYQRYPYDQRCSEFVGEGLAPPETFPIILLYHAEHINLSVGYGIYDVPHVWLRCCPTQSKCLLP